MVPREATTLPLLEEKKTSWHWYVEWMSATSAHLHGVEKILHSSQTPFQKLELYQTRDFGKLLVLDGDPQSSEHDEDIYHEALVHPAMVTCSQPPKRVLIFGGGEGATLREVLRHPSVEKAVMVDIDDSVVKLCKKELPSYSDGAFEDRRTELLIQDAREYVRKTSEKFDCVISDLTEPFPDSPSQGLLTEEFFQTVKKVLQPNGVLAMQASHAVRGKNRLYIHFINTLKKVWPIVRPYRAFVPSFYSEWGFILASDKNDPLKMTAQTIDEKLRPIASHLKFYDGPTHHAIFTPLKELRNYL